MPPSPLYGSLLFLRDFVVITLLSVGYVICVCCREEGERDVLGLAYVNSVIYGPWMEVVKTEIFLTSYFEKTHKALKFTFSIKA